mmetsp:Transcript_30523/g.27034  ORF Transcript_30523/g.27034 Transcript_30523/m.27034 type:complete len:83 (+) Transcript_30523:448-696(+)
MMLSPSRERCIHIFGNLKQAGISEKIRKSLRNIEDNQESISDYLNTPYDASYKAMEKRVNKLEQENKELRNLVNSILLINFN